MKKVNLKVAPTVAVPPVPPVAPVPDVILSLRQTPTGVTVVANLHSGESNVIVRFKEDGTLERCRHVEAKYGFNTEPAPSNKIKVNN